MKTNLEVSQPVLQYRIRARPHRSDEKEVEDGEETLFPQFEVLFCRAQSSLDLKLEILESHRPIVPLLGGKIEIGMTAHQKLDMSASQRPDVW